MSDCQRAFQALNQLRLPRLRTFQNLQLKGELQWLTERMIDREAQMGWFFRKSFRVLPGIRINLSKSGPRLSVGVPGARASIDMEGKARLYGGKGPLRYQKTVTLGASGKPRPKGGGLLEFVKGIFSG